MPPTTLSSHFGDRFQIEAESGFGGMGTVYRAIDLHSGQKVALKVLHQNQGRSTERFNQEAALLAELAHPAIVRYVDHGTTTGGDSYIAMEWLEGETLEERILKGPLTTLETARLGRRVLEAMALAHRKGIVHRDIKPSNLFLPGAELSQVKVLDFGIARRVFETRRLTMTGSTLGTPMYMSPEQAWGAPQIDGRSDIFSLGAVLFECATGHPPFVADTPVAVLAKICLETMDVRARCRDAPAPFVQLLSRMLAKDPEQRPREAADLAVEFGTTIESLVALGIDDNEAERYLRRRTPPPILTSGEQRVLSAIMISRPHGSFPLDPKATNPEAVSFQTWDIAPNISGTGEKENQLVDDAGFAQVKKVVEPFGARVDRFLGGAMVITIIGRGTPTDQATQAARLALKLKALLPRAVFAVSTGRAVMGEKVPIGDVVDWAARMIEGQRPGSVCVDDKTAGLLEARFEISDAKKKQLLFEKGITEAPRTVLGKEMPCVGRDREIGNLEALFDECIEEPVARAVLITAPAGGGKSRVRHEFLERIQQRGRPFQYLIGRGDSLRAGTPFGLLGPGLRAAAGINGSEPPAVQQRRLLVHISRQVKPEAQQRVAAFLGEMAGVHFPDGDLPALHAARQDPRLMADQMLAAWLDWLEAECSTRPVLLVLEDLHWGDVPSIQFVDSALRMLREKPLMVVAFGRPEIDEKFPGVWSERDLQRIALPPLTSKACQKLARQVLGDIGMERAAWIVERADGNPFYLEELLRAVAGGADLKKEGAIPDTVLGMVQARFDTLGTDAKPVLRAASIFGQTFSSAGVRVLLGDQDRSLDQWLDILSAREILFPRQGHLPAQGGSGGEYVFRHALLRDAAYEMLTGDDLKLGHRLAGDFLEKAGEREAIVLVEHFERDGELPKAAHWSRFAAAQALDANDLAAALARVERGVRCGADGEDLGAMRVTEAQARFWRGEYSQAERAAREAVGNTEAQMRLQAESELIAALGQQAKYGEVENVLKEVGARSVGPQLKNAWDACLLRAGRYLLPGGRYEATEEVLSALGSAAESLDPTLAARADDLRAVMFLHQGNQARAVAGFEAALRAFETLGNVRAQTEILVNVGMALGDLGVLEQAEQHLCAALTAADRMDLRFVSACVLMNLTLVRAYSGRLDEARAAGERACVLAREQGDRRIVGGAELYLSTVEHLAHNHVASETHARAAMDGFAEVPPVLPAAIAAVARALFGQSKMAEALYLAEYANGLLEEIGRVEDCETLIRLTLAECLIHTRDFVPARAVLRKAVIRLHERTASIEKPEWRATFLERIPDHARTIQLATEHGAMNSTA